MMKRKLGKKTSKSYWNLRMNRTRKNIKWLLLINKRYYKIQGSNSKIISFINFLLFRVTHHIVNVRLWFLIRIYLKFGKIWGSRIYKEINMRTMIRMRRISGRAWIWIWKMIFIIMNKDRMNFKIKSNRLK